MIVMTEVTEKQTRQVQSFVLDDGTVGSRAAYIRQEFAKDRSRKDIAEELGVSYNIVFSATANMFNSHHPETGGRGGNRSVIVEWPKGSGEMRQRSDVMKELFASGMSRADIAKEFDCPYATVYGATKDVANPNGAVHRGKIMIEHPETGEQIARVDYIRELWETGEYTRRQIADKIKCDYSVVWSATKEAKPESDEENTVEEVVEDTEEVVEDTEEINY